MGIKDSELSTATSVGAALRKGSVSVVELTDIHLQRLISAKELNAVISSFDPEVVREDAKALQTRLDLGEDGPSESALAGIATTIKDALALKGLPLTVGSRLLQGNISKIDAGVVAKAKAGGAMMMGKTNCPEFAFGIGTSNDLFGPTLNPLDVALSPGGSSGGEAVSVATGISLIGIGTDFGGSLRWPAQCVGVLAIRPTPQRLSLRGVIVGMGTDGLDGNSYLEHGSLMASLEVTGVLARCVDDLEGALGALSGPDAIDPYLPPVPLRSNREVNPRDLAIGWSFGTQIGVVGEDVMAAMADVVATMAQDGFFMKELPHFLKGAREAYDHLRSFDDLGDIRLLAKGREGELTKNMAQTLSLPIKERSGLADAWVAGMRHRERALEQFGETPIVLLPVAPGSAADLNERMVVGGQTLSGFELMAHCRAVSLLASPALSIPVGKSKAGLPISIQIVGKPWAEQMVFSVARRIEALFGGWQPIESGPWRL